MFKKTVFLILSFSAMLLAAGGSQANTINMAGYGGGGDGNVTCNGMASDACFGIIGSVGIMNSGDASFSSSSANAQSVTPNSPNDELAYLNSLLASFNPALPSVMGVDKTDGAGSGFTVTREYFSIKKGAGPSGGGTWFFKNNSGGALTVALAGGNDPYSHWTEYGSPVPVPAAVWLFGSGLLGLIGVARRRKA